MIIKSTKSLPGDTALADPTRRAILARLASGETSVTALAEPFEMSLPAVSKHLKVLERAGLIARSRDAQFWNCKERRRSMATGNSPGVSQEIVITRLFDAPRELVWKAWTDPAHVKRWWGPKTYTAPVFKMDFREGGTYLYCMRSPEGKDYWGTGVYREIVPGRRIVCTDSFADERGNPVPASHYGMAGDWPAELVVTVTFEELEHGRTKLTLRHVGIPAGQMSELTAVGWNESLDKLSENLASD
jgi:uncharacterized protein YndB with AHSA1/START domain